MRLLLATAAILIASCSARTGDDQTGVSADEARQLNEAAEMLDANSVDLNALAQRDNETDAP